MTRCRAVCVSVLAVWATLGGRADAQEEAPGVLRVPVPKTPPVFDGKLGVGEWDRGARFTVTRGGDKLGEGFLLRQDRQLLVGYRSELAAFALGLRLYFVDPVAQQRTVALVTPLQPPYPPLGLFRQRPGEPPEMLSASPCDIRLDLSRPETFQVEIRVSLDLLEFERADKPCLFGLEIWDLNDNRALAVFPVGTQGPMQGQGMARISAEGGWGVDVPLDHAGPPANEALALVEGITREDRWHAGNREGEPPAPLLRAYLGGVDGKRKDAPLAELEQKLRRLVAERPEYLSLHTALIEVLRGRNDFVGVLEAQDALTAQFPLSMYHPRYAIMRAEILVALGRYGAALDYLDEQKGIEEADPSVVQLKRQIENARANWKLEQEIRAAEAQRDDLPRVRLETTKGVIVLELFEDDAPNGVANFISLVESKAYDNTRFHWVTGGGRIVGGDPNSRDEDPFNDGYGDPGYLIESEPGRRLQFPFTVAYADKRDRRRSESSTFVIHISPLFHLDGFQTVLGRVVEGGETVLRIEHYDTIRKATVLRKREHEYTVAKRPH